MHLVDWEMAEYCAERLDEILFKEGYKETTKGEIETLTENFIIAIISINNPGPKLKSFYRDLDAYFLRLDNHKDFDYGAVYGALKFYDIYTQS